jgi:hypothetical protein
MGRARTALPETRGSEWPRGLQIFSPRVELTRVKLGGAERSKLKAISQKRSNAGKYLHAQQTPSVENNGSLFHVVRTAESRGDVQRWNQMPKSLPKKCQNYQHVGIIQ